LSDQAKPILKLYKLLLLQLPFTASRVKQNFMALIATWLV
jgi:hypothetical protein